MRAFAWVVVPLAVVVPCLAAAKARTPACPDGCFRVDGDPLLDVDERQDDTVETDVVVTDGRLVSTRTGCAPKKAKLRQGGRRLGVRWKACGEARKVRLKATFPDGDCDRLDGTWRRKRKPLRRFTAVRE